MDRYRFNVLLLIVFVLFVACSGDKEVDEKKKSVETTSWSIFRGDSTLTGTTNETIPDNLSLLWTFKTGGEIVSSPVIGFGYVYIGATDGKLYAIRLKDGIKAWTFDTGDDIEAPALLLDKTIYIGSLSGDVFALDARTGKVHWKYTTGNSIYGSANWMKNPGGNETLIYVGSHDNKMYCLDAASGRPIWTYETESYINGTPAVGNGFIIFGGCDEKLYILSAMDGKKIGAVDAGSYIPGSAALVGNKAFVGHYGNQLICIDIKSQAIIWAYGDKKDGAAFFSSPAVNKEYIVIGSRDGYLHCVDRETGAKTWTFRTRDDVDSSPVIAGNKVIAGSADGSLYVLNLEDGKETWSYEIGAPIIGCPAAAGGFIVTGAQDGRIYTFGEK